MEEEKMLKQKYNDLLESLYKGTEYLKQKPDDEKAQKRLDEIAIEMQNIMQAIPNMTDEERANGFKIEEEQKTVKKAITKQPEKNTDKKQDTSMQLAPKKVDVISKFNDNWEKAVAFSKSSLLPDEFKNHPENTIIAFGMAEKMGIDPFTICQNLHIIRGKLSWSGAFCKTLIEQSGKYTDLDFIYFGKENTDERGCYLEATRIKDGKRIQGNKVTIQLAKEEKWWNNNTKWKTMTDQMLRL